VILFFSSPSLRAISFGLSSLSLHRRLLDWLIPMKVGQVLLADAVRVSSPPLIVTPPSLYFLIF